VFHGPRDEFLPFEGFFYICALFFLHANELSATVHSLSSPALEEGGNGFRARVFKLFLALGVKEFAVCIQHGKSRYTLADRYMVLVGNAQVMVDVADVDMDHDVEPGEEFGIGSLMVVEVQYLAVATPVPAKIQQYAFSVVARDLPGGLNVCGSVRPFGVQILVHMKGGLS
jgi:hypothetical protein